MMVRARRVAGLLSLLIVGICAASVILVVNNLSDRVGRAEDHSQSSEQATRATQKGLTDANAKVTALSDQLKGLGKKPVVSAAPVVAPGAPGPGPTAGQVAVAIQAYCVAHGGCRGPAGLTIVGPKGDKGDTVTGPPGDSVKGDTGPAGPAGADGHDGAAGKDGRSVVSTQCGDDGRWTTTYSDGTTEDSGVCRVDVLQPTP